MKGADWHRARPATPGEFFSARRDWLAGGLAAFTLAALGAELAHARPAQRLPARIWIDRQAELARALRHGEISPPRWMEEAAALAAAIDVAQLMREVSQARIEAAALPLTNDPRKRAVRFLDARGEPRRLGYAAALFDFTPANVITPHGHRNMVSSHLVVAGSLRVRNFDRLRDEGAAMVIRPTRDYIATTGMLSAMSPQRDNVHWFVPRGGPARTFDVIVTGIDPHQPDYAIEAVDPLAAERLSDGGWRAPRIDFAAASRKYPAGV